jgi:hypothetical protein
VSLKDRAAILAVGRGADAAYWWDPQTGAFVSSSYYAAELPGWVQRFNDGRRADLFAGMAWTALYSEGRVLRQLPGDLGPPLYDAVYGSPYGNDLLLDFVLELLARERFGTRSDLERVYLEHLHD